MESVAAARSPLMAIAWTVAPRNAFAHCRAFALQAGICVLATRSHSITTCTRCGSCSRCRSRVGGEVPRPLVGGLGDRPPRPRPRPRPRGGEPHGRHDADGLAVEPAPLETSRAKRKLRLVSPAGQTRKTVVSPRGSPGGAATFVPQVALISAPLTASTVWLRTGASSCTVSTRPSRLKRTPASTAVATSVLPGGAASRSTSGLGREGHDDRDEGSDHGERHHAARRRAQPDERRAQLAERRTAFTPVFVSRDALELGSPDGPRTTTRR